MKTIEELRKLDQKGLDKELNSESQKLFKLKFDLQSGQSSNVADIKKYKKQIARINTIMTEKSEDTKN